MTTTSLNTQLFAACKGDDAAETERLLGLGADPSVPDAAGFLALTNAAKEGYFEICLLLLKHGADVNAKNKEDITALMHAASSGDTNLCLVLLEQGADVHLKDACGESALTLAAGMGETEACQILIDHGADMESLTEAGYPALCLALFKDYMETALTLIAAGASITAAEASLSTRLSDPVHRCLDFPLHEAARHGLPLACVKMLDLGYNLEQKDKQGKTPMECAGDAHEETQLAMRSWVARQAANQAMAEMMGAKP